MLITTNIVAGGLHYRRVQREYRLRTVATYFQQQKDHELKSHSSKSRMNARLVVTIMGDLFQILLLYASSIFLRRKNIFGVRGCVTIMRICIHVMKKKNFPFVYGIRVSFVINCPENGNLERHNMNLGHVSHCYAILQNLSTLVTVEISR